MEKKRNFFFLLSAVTISLLFGPYVTGGAASIPFRSVKVGEKLPGLTLKDVSSQEVVGTDRFTGKPLLFIFFGTDIPAKRKRSVDILKAVQELAPFLEESGISVLAVSAQGDPADVVNEAVSESGFSYGVYADVDSSAYGGLGLFVIPSILLVKADGQVTGGLGYSHDFAKRIKGEIDIMLGRKSRDQVEEELHPRMVEKTAEEKGAKRHLNLGMTMKDRGQPESAMREFQKAISLEPEMGEAHVWLGCLQLEEGMVEEAADSLAKGLDLDPDSASGRICQARLKAEQGDVDTAIEDLEQMMFRNSRNDRLHYTLGLLLEKKGEVARASDEYRKAYELLEKKRISEGGK